MSVCFFRPLRTQTILSRFLAPTAAYTTKISNSSTPPASLELIAGILTELKDGFESFKAYVKTDMDCLKADMDGLKADVNGLKADVNGLKADVNGLKADVNGLKIDVKRLTDGQGMLCETVARTTVEKQFGSHFSKSLVAKSISDLISPLVKGSAGSKGILAEDANFDTQLEVANRITSCLVKENVCQNFVKEIEKRIMLDQERGSNAPDSLACLHSYLPFVDGSGNISTSFSAAIGVTPAFFKPKMVRIKKLMNDSLYMNKCEGPGIMLVVFAANPRIDIISLPEELEIDFRGSIQVIEGHLQVAVGEYKTSMSSYREAKYQLTLRAQTYGWVGKALAFPKPLTSTVLKGHFFTTDRSKGKHLPQDDVAEGVSIFIHVI